MFTTNLMPFIAFLSLSITFFAFIFSTRKEAHHVRLELTKLNNHSLILGINNDSAVAFGILSIGYFQNTEKIEWIKKVANHATNQFVTYPIRVEARSLLAIELGPWGNNIPSTKIGICIQLETGRMYILNNSLTFRETIKFQFSAAISRISRGKFSPGISNRPRLPYTSDNS